MGFCPMCEEGWEMRSNTKFIIKYMGETFVAPDIGPDGGLSGKIEKMEERYNCGDVAIKLNVPFTIEKQLGDNKPELLCKKDFKTNLYDMIGHLLAVGNLDKYKVEKPISPQSPPAPY